MQQAPMIADEVFAVDVSDVEPYGNNPRKFSVEDVDNMAALIETYGFRIPIIVQEGDGKWKLIDGHLRMRAAAKLGMTTVPAIDASDMPDEMVKTFRVSVNRAANFAEWDIAKLNDELAGIDLGGDTLRLTGFTDDDLAGILATEDRKAERQAVRREQSVSKSADRRSASRDDDVVSLKMDMRLADRATVMDWLDTEMRTRGLMTRSAVLVALAGESAPRRRVRVRK